jgi:hypothetical protein
MGDCKMDVKDERFEGVEWIRLPKDRDKRRDFVKTVMHICVP